MCHETGPGPVVYHYHIIYRVKNYFKEALRLNFYSDTYLFTDCATVLLWKQSENFIIAIYNINISIIGNDQETKKDQCS